MPIWQLHSYMDVSKNRGFYHPKMDGLLYHGSKPYEQMGWFGGKNNLFLETSTPEV